MYHQAPIPFRPPPVSEPLNVIVAQVLERDRLNKEMVEPDQAPDSSFGRGLVRLGRSGTKEAVEELSADVLELFDFNAACEG